MASKKFVIFVEVNAGVDNPELIGFLSEGGFIESNWHHAKKMDEVESNVRFQSLLLNTQTRVITLIEISSEISIK